MNAPETKNELAADGGRAPRLVLELRWARMHLAATTLFFALMVAGGYWMIFEGRDDVMNAFRGAYIMYAAIKIDGWLARKSSLPNETSPVADAKEKSIP